MAFDANIGWDSKFDPDNFKDTLDSMLSTANAEMATIMTNAGQSIEADAKRRVPVLTGNLRGSIESETRTQRDTITTEVGTNVVYAPHVEYGYGQRPQPYLRPAVDREISDLERQIVEAVHEAAYDEGSV